MGPSLFSFIISIVFFLWLIITCRLWAIYVREDNYSKVKLMITRLIWTIWTPMSSVPKRQINLISLSLLELYFFAQNLRNISSWRWWCYAQYIYPWVVHLQCPAIERKRNNEPSYWESLNYARQNFMLSSPSRPVGHRISPNKQQNYCVTNQNNQQLLITLCLVHQVFLIIQRFYIDS